MTAKYDTIGKGYRSLRKADPRIERQILRALEGARRVLNVGAGTGSYEPRDREVTAIEPSMEMIRQREPSPLATVIQGHAEQLPFEDGSFDASMAILTIHHWSDRAAGLMEMRRVTRGPVVVLTYDPCARPWLTDYFPELITLDEEQMPAMSDYALWLGGEVEVEPVKIPHDCEDGFLHAYWRRPYVYLDEERRLGSSSFWRVRSEEGVERLRGELERGEWASRYGWLLDEEEYDAGYRLITAS